MRQLNYHNVQTPNGPLPATTIIALNVYTDDLIADRHFGGGGMFSDGVLIVRLEDCAPATAALNIWFQASGYKPVFWREPMPGVGQQEGAFAIPVLEPSAVPFPPGVKRPAIAPPFDPSDSFGEVHTTPPPELQLPQRPDLMTLRADFNGVTIPGHYTPTDTASIIAQGGVTMTDGPYQGLRIPFLVGANTTPPTMLMTPMLPLYPADVQQVVFAEHLARGYTHFIWDPSPWNAAQNGVGFTPAQAVTFGGLVKSMGFFSATWRGDVQMDDPFLTALRANGLIDFAVAGEEVDSGWTAERYEALLDNLLAGCLKGIPTCAHFTSNYPEGFPRDTFLTNWDKYDGRLHLAWQANQNDSAGKQGAMLYYARQRVNLGLVGGNGNPAPNSRVYLWEIMATAQLYGLCTEAYGNLRSLEGMYCPAGLPGILANSGYGNGSCQPDGWGL